MRQTGFQQAFNVGELGPDAWSRSDLAQASKGCILGFNMLGRVVGPTGRRQGTWFCGTPRHADLPGRLIPFRRSQGDALLLEFGEGYGRVRTVNGDLVLNGGVAVDFGTPWSAAQVGGLRVRQIGDAVFFTHRDGTRPYTLVRNSNVSWTLTPTEFLDGPWRGENSDDGKVLTFDGSTLTSNFDLFQPGHVGGLFRLRANDGNPGVLSWEPGEENVPAGARRASNGQVYFRAGTTDDCGNTPPVHVDGTVSDGKVEWTHLTDGAAVIRIGGYVGPREVAAFALHGVPDGLETGTRYWSEAAYSDVRGWPSAPAVTREERLAMAAPPSEPDAIDFTRTAGFRPTGLDFKPGLGTGRVVDDDGVRRFVGDERNRIVWLAGSTFLLAGTTDGEFLISGATVDDPISPAGCVARPIGEFGSADVMPVLAHGGVLFVAAGGETLRHVGVAPDQSLSQSDKSVVAGHIGQRGLAELTWLKQPWNFVWVRLTDGGQASFTFHAEQNVEGWNRHGIGARGLPTPDEPLAGGMTLESSCVVPGVNGRPRLFMLVRREKAGVTQRLILRMADPEDKLFLDAAEAYVGGAVNAVGGLDHLAGEAVTMMAATEASASAAPGRGWGEYRDRAVSGGGSAALPEDTTATRIYAGLPFRSRWEGLPPEMAGPGSGAGRKVRYTHAAIVLEAAVAYAGTVGAEGDSQTDRLLSREPGDVAGPVSRRQTWRPALLGGAGYERRFFLETDHGWDMVIHSIRAVGDVD
ncbi:hypothetical protein [Brevundimonas vesicularis]|uniref:Uncharacterized protein n=1 Tax=Brevundimonas vesicularis TaxID=41276 RepID=A0A1Z3U585_BREVE|nr:hypothetical protein [Brevundimonas vesicularis]ASE38415.1 hypothetical protein CEP68_02225 [Brevundimonas vesicularis]